MIVKGMFFFLYKYIIPWRVNGANVNYEKGGVCSGCEAFSYFRDKKKNRFGGGVLVPALLTSLRSQSARRGVK